MTSHAWRLDRRTACVIAAIVTRLSLLLMGDGGLYRVAPHFGQRNPKHADKAPAGRSALAALKYPSVPTYRAGATGQRMRRRVARARSPAPLWRSRISAK